MYLKNLFKNKNIYVFILFLISFVFNFENYEGNKVIFFIFNISAFLLSITLLRKNVPAFELFFFIFLLLSFWFKFSFILIFDDLIALEGDFDLLKSNYDKTLIVIILTFLSCTFASFLRQIIFKIFFNNKKKTEMKKYFINFYIKNRFKILLFFISSLIITWSLNYSFKIYSRGIVNTETIPLVKHLFSWLLTYGLSVFISFLIFIDFCIFKDKKYFFLGIFETFFTNISLYSRSFILSTAAYLRGYYFLIDFKKNLNENPKYYLKIIFILFILFLISFYSVSQLRTQNFKKTEFIENVSIKNLSLTIVELSITRWVGIDGLLAVSQNDNLSFDLFKESLKEKKKTREKSFYMNNFFTSFNFINTESENLNVVFTPGIIAFLYYTGSLVFVSLSVIIIILFCNLIEKLFLYYSGNNVIISSIIGYTLAQRLIHFGYVPINTINYLLSFLVTLILLFFISKLVWNKHEEKN